MDREDLKYKYLNRFDNDMIELVSQHYNFQALPVEKLWEKDDDQILAYSRGDLVFVYNFNPAKSFSDYGILTAPGKYEVVLSSDNPAFGGYDNIDESITHFTIHDDLYSPLGVEWLKLYLPARSAMVLRRVHEAPRKAAPKTGKKTVKKAEKPAKTAKTTKEPKAAKATKTAKKTTK